MTFLWDSQPSSHRKTRNGSMITANTGTKTKTITKTKSKIIININDEQIYPILKGEKLSIMIII